MRQRPSTSLSSHRHGHGGGGIETHLKHRGHDNSREPTSFKGKVRPSQSVIFNTCRYQEDLEGGKRPQQSEGTLRGLQCLSLECTCGDPSNHDIITGPEKSKVSATYPKALCEAYAKLAIDHLKLIGKEEFLRSRMASLQNSIEVAKAEITRRDDKFGPGADEDTPPRPRSRPRIEGGSTSHH